MKSFALIFLSFLLYTLPTFSQSFQVEGTLTDNTTGEPLAGASVRIPALKQGTFTDENGKFSFEIPSYEQENISLVFSYAGYESMEKSFSTGDGDLIGLNFGLSPVSFSTDDVVITASKGLEQRQSD
ncbi:MAG: carboxypeptidase-like regulatory domain-containing protein, partial [Bacteroidota bacterium]